VTIQGCNFLSVKYFCACP